MIEQHLIRPELKGKEIPRSNKACAEEFLILRQSLDPLFFLAFSISSLASFGGII